MMLMLLQWSILNHDGRVCELLTLKKMVGALTADLWLLHQTTPNGCLTLQSKSWGQFVSGCHRSCSRLIRSLKQTEVLGYYNVGKYDEGVKCVCDR